MAMESAMRMVNFYWIFVPASDQLLACISNTWFQHTTIIQLYNVSPTWASSDKHN